MPLPSVDVCAGDNTVMAADLPAAAGPTERVLCEPAERLEELLTCPICFEPMDTAMMLTCSHNCGLRAGAALCWPTPG